MHHLCSEMYDSTLQLVLIFYAGTKSQMDNDETEGVFLGGLDIET